MKPNEGLLFYFGKYQYKIFKVDDTEVHAVRLNEDGTESNKKKDFPLFQWPPEGVRFEIKDPPPPELSDEYTFVFDDESKSIVVRDRKGREVAKLPGFYGKEGKTFYDVWIEKEKPENQSWEEFKKFWTGNKGETGESGSTPYIKNGYWYINGKDTGVKAIGQDGHNGDDGKSAYDFWKEKQERGKDSEVDFLSFLEGKPGKDGESAFQLWQRLYPDEPNKTEEGFLRWIAKQVETQKGDPGDTYIPFVKDGHLFFRKNGGEGPMPFDPLNIIGEVGDTYEPHVDKNGNIWFTSKKGNKPTTPVNIKGEQGKSAYDLWREEPGNANKSYDEFKESLRGADGVNVKAKYDFKDLEDYVCPVQKIPTHLLLGTDGLDDDKSAEGILNDRAEEIQNMRREGENLAKEKGWTFKHLFKEVMWWCAGADRPLLRMCPADHSKYAGIGTVILFTALMASFSSFIAMQLVLGVGSEGLLNWNSFLKDPSPYIIAGVFGIFWGLMIFFLDRFITNTMYSDGKVTISWLEFRSALPRILISVLLGIVISAPLELKIFNQEVEKQIAEDYKSKILADYNKENVSILDSISKYEKIFDNRENNASKLNELDKRRSFLENKIDQINKKYSSTPRIARNQGVNESDENYQKYLKGLSSGNKARSEQGSDEAMRQSKKEREELDSINQEIGKLSGTVNQEIVNRNLNLYYAKRDSLQGIKEDKLKDTAVRDFVGKAGLYQHLTALHNVALQSHDVDGYKPLNWPKNRQYMIIVIVFLLLLSFTFKSFIGEFEEDDDSMKGRTKKWNLVSTVPICLVIAILCGICYESLHWLFYYLSTAVGLIMLLFIIIDVSPVFYKMMLADGVYDKKLHEDKKIAEDKIRLNLAKTLFKMDQSELANIAPFVFNRTYEKMTRKIKDSKFTFDSPQGIHKELSKKDKALFDRVSMQKELIIKAAYDAWFRNMRDAIIGGAQPPGSGNDKTQGSNYKPEDNFTQEPGSSFENDNTKSGGFNDPNDGDFEETSSRTSERINESTSGQESSYSDEENRQYEHEVDDEDLNQSETPKD